MVKSSLNPLVFMTNPYNNVLVHTTEKCYRKLEQTFSLVSDSFLLFLLTASNCDSAIPLFAPEILSWRLLKKQKSKLNKKCTDCRIFCKATYNLASMHFLEQNILSKKLVFLSLRPHSTHRLMITSFPDKKKNM